MSMKDNNNKHFLLLAVCYFINNVILSYFIHKYNIYV